MSLKVGRHEGSCCRDMRQRLVAAMKNTCVVYTAATCSRDVRRGHLAGTKSQHVHTHENVAVTCPSDMLQRHVPSCQRISLRNTN